MLSRREFLDILTGIGGLAAMADCSSPSGRDRQAADPPNVVVIVADDTGWADVGYHGSEIRTPVLDRLVSRGIELNRFYSDPVCSPTRAALLTGKPPSRFGIITPLRPDNPNHISPETTTIADVFTRAGYDTALIGKWHLGMKRELLPDRYGFRYTYGYYGPWIDQYAHITIDDTPDWHRNGVQISVSGHATDLLTDEAVRFITTERDATKPFFLLLTYSVPHLPMQEEERWLKPYRETIDNDSRRYFAASMTHMDDAIGRCIAALDEAGIARDTLVLFFSDNGGATPGFRSWVPESGFFNGTRDMDDLGRNIPLRDYKASVYEGGIRVPACAYWPGTLKPGVSDCTVTVRDLFSTLAVAAGIELPSDAAPEGVNCWDAIVDRSVEPERILYWRLPRQLAVRKGQWKLVHRGRTPSEGKNELFNVFDDPFETTDCSALHPETVSELSQELQRQFAMDPS